MKKEDYFKAKKLKEFKLFFLCRFVFYTKLLRTIENKHSKQYYKL